MWLTSRTSLILTGQVCAMILGIGRTSWMIHTVLGSLRKHQDGDWDEEATPSFGPNLVPKGSNLYPALSFKGRAQLLRFLSGVVWFRAI